MSTMLKTRSGQMVILPTPEEDAAITAAALSDPDAQRPPGLRKHRPRCAGTPVYAITTCRDSVRTLL